jgi:hypothetical protein
MQETSGYSKWSTYVAKPCHPERSEGSSVGDREILRYAQDDKDVLRMTAVGAEHPDYTSRHNVSQLAAFICTLAVATGLFISYHTLYSQSRFSKQENRSSYTGFKPKGGLHGNCTLHPRANRVGYCCKSMGYKQYRWPG